jgi:hypothetical protein
MRLKNLPMKRTNLLGRIMLSQNVQKFVITLCFGMKPKKTDARYPVFGAENNVNTIKKFTDVIS